MVACCLLLSTVERAGAATLPPGFTDSVAFSGLNNPTALRFSPDGRVFVAEKGGLIKVFDNLSDTSPTVFADLRTNVHGYWDRGLLGMALDPGFPSNPYVYVLYTYDHVLGSPDPAPRWGTPGATSDSCPTPPGPTSDGCVVSGRLSRLRAAGNVMTGSEEVLIEDWCQQYPSHSVGSLAFGADGALYATAGEGASFTFNDYGQDGSPLNPCGDPPGGAGATLTPPTAEGGRLRSQDLRTAGDPVTLDGAVIRVNPATGGAASGNPFATSSDPNARRIIAYGLRNPFRFVIRPGTNDLWIGDVGGGAWEEINRVPNPTDGVVENFGWPCYEGSARHGGFDSLNVDICENLYAEGNSVTNPVFAYRHQNPIVAGENCPTGSSSITGVAFSFYTGGPYPADYDGALFFADYSRDCIWVMQRGTNNLPNPANIKTFVQAAESPVDLQVSPSGELFYVDLTGGTIHRIQFAGAANNPPTARASADPTSGAAPLTVTFDGTASSDPDAGDTLSYSWDLDGDGTYGDSTEARPTHVFTAAGSYTVRLRVTDSRGASATDSVTVTAGSRPAATIDAPTASTTWKVGEAIAFSGSASDPDEDALPPAAFSWEMIMHHCPASCHTHTLETRSGIASGSFTAPDHEYPSHLELRLTVTDSSGLTDTASVQLDPKTVQLRFDSSPSGLQLTVGGSTSPTPFTRTVIEGSANSISAPSPQSMGGTSYVFGSWSDGGAASHDVVADPAAASLTARYEAAQTLTLAAEADAQVREASSTSNYGSAALRVDGGSGARVESYLRFTIPSGIGTIQAAKLRLLASSPTADGPAAYTASSGWSETGLTWANRPVRSGAATDDKARIATGAWVEFNVKPLVSGPGTYTFVLAGASTDGVDFYSREAAAANRPHLVLDTGGGGGAPPPGDTSPPSDPRDLAATAAGSTQINLAWTGSSDNVGVTGYEVYRRPQGGTFTRITTTSGPGTTYADNGLSPLTTYEYQVRARDAAGNVSGPSNTASATTAGTGPPPAGISLVKQATGSVTGATTLSIPISTTAGSALVASVAVKAGSSVSVTRVADSTGTAWTKGAVGFLTGSNTRIEIWYRLGAPAVTAVTATLSASNTVSANVTEWSGVAATGALVGASGAGNAASTTAATPAVTAAQAGTLVIGAVNYPGSIGSTLASAGFTALNSFSVSTTVNGRAAYRVTSASGSYRASWTLTASAASGGAVLALAPG